MKMTLQEARVQLNLLSFTYIGSLDMQMISGVKWRWGD